MSKSEDMTYVTTCMEQLDEEQRQCFQKVESEVRKRVSSHKKADIILCYMIDEWLDQKESLCVDGTDSTSLQHYCDTFITDVSKKLAFLQVARAARIGVLVLSMAFALQSLIHFIGFFTPSVEATKFSLFPFLFLALFGLLGIYLVQRSVSQKHGRVWKIAGYTSQVFAVLLFFAGMKWWDKIFTFKLTFLLSTIFFALSMISYIGLLRWQQMLEHKDRQEQSMQAAFRPKP